jgi:hypothetical protein
MARKRKKLKKGKKLAGAKALGKLRTLRGGSDITITKHIDVSSPTL